jgi:propanol-preferring alcohol dehydrogenase
MADLMLVPSARFLVPLPDGLDPVQAAPLTDAGLTPYHAVRRSWAKLTPGTTAVVIGVGGLGHLAVQILKATTAARVVAVDTRAEALALAADGGADLTLEPDDAAVPVIRETTGGRGADVVLDFVGSDPTIALGAAVSRFLGDVTVVGIAGGTFPFTFFSLPYEASLQTTYWGSRPELVEVLDLAARGLLQPTVTTYPLEEAAHAYELMASGSVLGRQVVVPSAAP